MYLEGMFYCFVINYFAQNSGILLFSIYQKEFTTEVDRGGGG